MFRHCFLVVAIPLDLVVLMALLEAMLRLPWLRLRPRIFDASIA